jgi:hypothetical protein
MAVVRLPEVEVCKRGVFCLLARQNNRRELVSETLGNLFRTSIIGTIVGAGSFSKSIAPVVAKRIQEVQK